MLHSDTISRLMKRFENGTTYQISIIDRQGVIVSCKDAERIGSFHKHAHQIIANDLPDWRGSDEPDENENSVILKIRLGDSIEGAVEVLGTPEKVLEPAKLLRAAIEETLESKASCRMQAQQATLHGRFCEQLLYDPQFAPTPFQRFAPPIYSPDLPHLNGRAKILGYQPDCPRIAIMLSPFKEQYQDFVEKLCRNSENVSSQDIIMRPIGIQTLIFFSLRPTPHLCGSYREQVENYLAPIWAQLEQKGILYRCVIGSIQNRLDQYQAAFQHCMWTVNNVKPHPAASSTDYFYNHVHEYLHSRIAPDELSCIFGAFTKFEPDSFWKDYVSIITAMNRHQNNMIKSSEALHMHKNTLAYRYKQIRTQLGLNPLQSTADDFFATELCHYLQSR